MRITNNQPYPIHETSNVIQFRPKVESQQIKQEEPLKLTRNDKIAIGVMTVVVTGLWVLIFLL